MRRRNASRAAVALAGLLLAAAPAAADWLVTRAGGRVETKGPWRTKGKLIVFTQEDGTLASLRLADVDLPASEKVTAEAKIQAAAPPAPEPPKKKKLAVLTDENFPRKTPPPEAKPEEGAQDGGQPGAKPAGTVIVANWQRFDRPSSDGIEIRGTLQNTTAKIAANAGVDVLLFNEAGQRVAKAPGILTTPSIQPNGAVEFRASFPGVFSYAEAKFETRGFPMDLSPAPAAEANPQ